jgi:hypothetical protein
METRNLTDSMNALRPAAPLLPLDTDTEDANPGSDANGCPPEWPNCGTDPKVSGPASVLVERAAPEQP